MRLIILFSAILLTISSCKREGCMDAEATNFNEKAKKNDGSCKYEASIVWWYDEGTASWLETAHGASSLSVKIDWNTIATSDLTTFWNTAPDCSTNGALIYPVEMFNIKTDTVNYAVQDDNKFVHWEGSVVLTPNECKVVHLN